MLELQIRLIPSLKELGPEMWVAYVGCGEIDIHVTGCFSEELHRLNGVDVHSIGRKGLGVVEFDHRPEAWRGSRGSEL